MNDENNIPAEEKDFPRWLQIFLGLILGLICVIGTIGSIFLIVSPTKKAPLLCIVFGLIMTTLSLWALKKCFNLIIGKRTKGGLVSPLALRVASIVFLLLPISGLFTGFFKTHTMIALVQTGAYILTFFGLQNLATRRELEQKSANDSSSSN